ncbi:NAD-reducing hydrogenase HoxS subunit beta [Methanimicrococcus sp. At1]|uniref:Coenzyme F420 hydrogenase subunit alpha n=1 Tax=Methanimicrococcus hacksteinii TaxID=3028293 RepID=A0ABU3VMM9_9EURY|nr:coenzyme F420 hydrogenase subunit alpha [Methanimicrococcus sp. At1]MDV0444663.1 NAD-reducing hydrogenase HoxS subunit beta [Methanimicrococcus sp. At1]
MSKTVEIKPTTRHEGHTNLVLTVDDEGIVESGAYHSVTPVRGFEKFLYGKVAEFAPIAVSRFCGICPTAHSTSSVEALERACGMEPTKDGLILRELTAIGNKMHSHPLHQFLIAPDYVPQEDYAEVVKRIQEMRKIGQYFVDTIGGEAIHPPNIKIGGMAKNISPEAKDKLIARAKNYLELAAVQCDYMMNIYNEGKLNDGTELPEKLGYHDFPLLATSLTYGDISKFDYSQAVEYSPFEVYPKEVALHACTNIPKYKGSLVEVGPRARMVTFKDFKETKGALGIHKARALEMACYAERALELLGELNTNGAPFCTDPIVGDGETVGVGAIEAARGHNVHAAIVGKDGRIVHYSAIVATTWNIPVIGEAITGSHYKFAEHVVRAYDPCVSCATHMIAKDYDGNTVGEKIFK